MMIKDRFLYFTYNGIHSSEFGAFYENSGTDISFPFSHTARHQTSSPLYQDRTFWLGSNKEPKSFSMDIAVGDKTLYETEKIFEWLNPNKPGKLSIDYRPNYTYDVIIDSISPSYILPKLMDNGLVKNILLFSITFLTVNTHLAETTNSFYLNNESLVNEDILVEPDNLFPIVLSKNGAFNFVNWSQENQFLNMTVSGSNLQVSKSGVSGLEQQYLYALDTSKTIRINTEIGSITEGDELIEAKYPDQEISNLGPMPIEPGTIFSGDLDITVSGGMAAVKTNSLFKSLGKTESFVMVIEPEINEKTPMVELSKEDGKGLLGLYPGREIDGEKIVVYPKFLLGARSPGSSTINFTVGNTGLKTGTWPVKIAGITKVNVETNGEFLIDFKYRKGT